jgi:hypothetical protein
MAQKTALTTESYSTLLEKLIYILLFGLILYNLGLINSCYPVGYKVNIFDQVPAQFWYFMIITYAIASFQLLKKPNSKFRYVGVVVLLINYVLFLFLPNRLSYLNIGDIDDLSYLGEIKSIITAFHTNIDNIYPASHVFYSITSIISGIEVNNLSTLIPVFFSLTFVCGIIVFSKNTLEDKITRNDSLLLILLFPVATIYYLRYMHFSIAPNGSFFMLIPIYLLVIYKYVFTNKNRSSFAILMTILMLVLPFSHPFIILFFTYVISILSVSGNRFSSNIKKPFSLILLLIVVTTFWVISNSFYLHALEAYSHISQAVAMSGMETFRKAYDVISLKSILLTLIFLYGRYVVPLSIILVAAIKIYKSKDSKSQQQYWIRDSFKKHAILYILFALLDIILILNPFLTHTVKRLTTLNFVIFAQVPLFVLSINCLISDKKAKNSGLFVISIILSVIFTLSIFGSLSSPLIYEPNTGVTLNEVEGMQWCLNFKNETVNITSPLSPQIGARYRDLLQGWNVTEPRIINIPSHFGYHGNGEIAFNNLYIAIMGYDELLYSSVFVYEKSNGRAEYNSEDFSRFRNDIHVQKIYDSLDIEIYKT